MGFKIAATPRADALLENLIVYLVESLRNDQAAAHLLSGYEKLYSRLSENPFQFPLISDEYLASTGIRYALVPDMRYMLVFEIRQDTVVILAYYHQTENYADKIMEDMA